MQVQRTFKRREGVWGIVKGDKGRFASSPPVSLDEINHVWNRKEMFRFAQHDKIPCVIARR